MISSTLSGVTGVGFQEHERSSEWRFLVKTLDELVQKLPPDLQREVEDFARFLLETRAEPKTGRLRMDWAGALSEFRERFTSLELQKKALEWWGD